MYNYIYIYIHTVLSGPATAANQPDFSTHFPACRNAYTESEIRGQGEGGRVRPLRDGFRCTMLDAWPQACHECVTRLPRFVFVVLSTTRICLFAR